MTDPRGDRVRAPRRAGAVGSLAAGVALAALAALALACGDEQAQAGPGQGPAPDDDALFGAWKQAGLEVSAFTDADPARHQAASCRAGTVGGVEVVVCSYASAEAAAAAQEPALARLEQGGTTTASALARGSRLLVVDDKRKADPSGRTIHAITAAFRR